MKTVSALSALLILITTMVNGKNTDQKNSTAMRLIFCKTHPEDQLCHDTSNIKADPKLLSLKGYPLSVVYNRVPKTGSEMLRLLFRDQSLRQNFSIDNKEIFVPFRLDPNVQQEVIHEISYAKLPFFYERHMYFLNFDAYKQPQPIYINIIRDPVDRVISEYYWSRKICREEDRCYFEGKFLYETLDDCVLRRSANECVSVSQGVNSIIPFFCGHHADCETRGQFALDEAKQNIIEHYTVVGILEEVYNFLYVLERLLPRYFTNVCLTYMSNGRIREENKTQKTGNRTEPSEATKTLLRAALADEYELYDFVKQRFHAQFRQLVLNMSDR